MGITERPLPRTRYRIRPSEGGERISSPRVDQILSELLAKDLGPTTLPRLLCDECATALPVDGVGLALMTEAGPAGLVAATDERATTMEELQFNLGEGPCVDASNLRRPVLHPDLDATAAARWPAFGPAALEAGIRAIFAFPLHVGSVRVGVLDLYRAATGGLSSAELLEALSFAEAARRLLLHLQDQMPLGDGLHPDLRDAGPDRSEVHQATGMISVQAGVGLAEALMLLRARAFSTGRSITEVAFDVVNRTLRFSPEAGDDE